MHDLTFPLLTRFVAVAVVFLVATLSWQRLGFAPTVLLLMSVIVGEQAVRWMEERP